MNIRFAADECRAKSNAALSLFDAIKDIPDTRRQVGIAERFGEKIDAGVKPAVVDDGVASIAGCEKGLDPRA
jgi:hypothetical protein